MIEECKVCSRAPTFKRHILQRFVFTRYSLIQELVLLRATHNNGREMTYSTCIIAGRGTDDQHRGFTNLDQL